MKIKNVITVVLLFAPILILANGGHHIDPESTKYFKLTGRVDDFWQRVLNFSIFAGVVYYLVANPIREFFRGRSAEIERQLKEIETKLQESKREAESAQKRLSDAEERSKEIVETGRSEAKILVENIDRKNNELLSSMEKHLQEKMEVEKKKMAKETIRELLESGIDGVDIAVDNSKVVSLISKKVA